MPPPPSSRATVRATADLLIVGSGIAGLRAAVEAAGAGLRVMLFAKDTAADSNTAGAQGGIAVALNDDDEVGLHYKDTIAAGDGLCDEAAVRVLVEEGPRHINELIGWGVQFDREGTRLHFTREGAHSARRILHAAGDSTGQEILRVLLQQASSMKGIEYLPKTYTLDLVVEGDRCAGLLCLDEAEGALSIVRGPVLLATGGSGQVYRETTNPPQATGDGIAIAYRAGAWVRDMEFVQFHPTALAVPGAPRFLLSEALRGEGAYLRDVSGRRFMLDIDPIRAELAPRDIVARAIARRIAETGGSPVSLDLTHMGSDAVARRFPRIFKTCLSYGVDIGRDLVPVSPCAHYMMGGVATDLWGRTSVPGLFAAGEVACSGVHGANRLASNSLLEGLVFGARAGRALVEDASRASVPVYGPGDPSPRAAKFGLGPDLAALGEEAVEDAAAAEFCARVREITWNHAGLLRDGEGLRRACSDLRSMARTTPPSAVTRAGVEARNLHVVATLITGASLIREESRGAHFRTDFPSKADALFRRSFLLGARGEVREMTLAGGTGHSGK